MKKKNNIEIKVSLSLGDIARYHSMIVSYDHERYIRQIVIKTLKEEKLI